MRHRTFFDEGLFLVSFSVALGVLALIIPAHGAPANEVRAAGPSGEYVELCDTGTDQQDCVAAVQFIDDADTASGRLHKSR